MTMETTLTEKEFLMREVHHRIKNNLQMISSFLSLEAAHSPAKTTGEIIKASQDRIMSLAILHDNFYQSEDPMQINLKDYIPSILDHLLKTASFEDSRPKIKCELDEVFFPIETSIPLGLILNEILGRNLAIRQVGILSATKKKTMTITGKIINYNYRLTISDNSRKKSGHTSHRDLSQKLIKGLVSQINGKLINEFADESFYILFIPLKK